MTSWFWFHQVILADFEGSVVVDYSTQLKNSHKGRYVLENQWPPSTPTTFINLGYIIHDPERTSKEAMNTTISETLGREKNRYIFMMLLILIKL